MRPLTSVFSSRAGSLVLGFCASEVELWVVSMENVLGCKAQLCHQNTSTEPQTTSDTPIKWASLVYFFLIKETLEAIHRLSMCLNVQPSAFSYAGIKDKKAVTKQSMVVRGVTPEQWVFYNYSLPCSLFTCSLSTSHMTLSGQAIVFKTCIFLFVAWSKHAPIKRR